MVVWGVTRGITRGITGAGKIIRAITTATSRATRLGAGKDPSDSPDGGLCTTYPGSPIGLAVYGLEHFYCRPYYFLTISIKASPMILV